MTESNNKQNPIPDQIAQKEASNIENKLGAFDDCPPVDIEITLELEPTEKPSDLPPISSLCQAKAILETLLFATTEPLSLNRLVKLTGLSQRTLRGLLLQLQLEYQRNSAGLQILEVAGGFQMATRPECHPWLAKLKLSRTRTQEQLSVAALETLGIIAYKQPITRLEIDAIRGVDSSGIIRKLLEMDLIKVVGKKPAPQRANLYGTTREFLRMFGLKSLNELPSLSDLRDLLGLARRQNLTKIKDTTELHKNQ